MSTTTSASTPRARTSSPAARYAPLARRCTGYLRREHSSNIQTVPPRVPLAVPVRLGQPLGRPERGWHFPRQARRLDVQLEFVRASWEICGQRPRRRPYGFVHKSRIEKFCLTATPRRSNELSTLPAGIFWILFCHVE